VGAVREVGLGEVAQAPWLAAARQRAQQMIAGGRLSHALLLQGQPGLGKRALAEWIARLALCDSPEDGACGRCPSCQLLAAGSHPDLQRLLVPEDKKQIPVDAVRELITALSMKSYRGRRKVALVDPADAMNTNGANALLKTLEEPSGDALLILTVSRPERLPATIASRCQRVKITPPSREVALAWLAGIDATVDWDSRLALTAGAPLAALDLATLAPLDKEMTELVSLLSRPDADVVGLAERSQGRNPTERLRWIENWVTDRIRRGLTAPATDHSPGSPGLPAGLRTRHIQGLYRVLDETRLARASLHGNANVTMLFERLYLMLVRELEPLRAARGRG
jgi:DNA polymerase-3 subunit delta'